MKRLGTIALCVLLATACYAGYNRYGGNWTRVGQCTPDSVCTKGSALVSVDTDSAEFIAIPDCDNATTSKLLFDTTASPPAFSCGTDQGGTFDSTAWNDLTWGDNTDATLVHTFDPTGATNPAWSYTSGYADLTTGVLRQGGVNVALGVASSTTNGIAKWSGTGGQQLADSTVQITADNFLSQNISYSGTATGLAAQFGGTWSPSSTSANSFRASYASAIGAGSSTMTAQQGLIGAEGTAQVIATAAVTGATGVRGRVYNAAGASGRLDNGYGVRGECVQDTLTDNMDFCAAIFAAASNSISGSITAPYGFYQEGASDPNYFAGKVGINQTVPARWLEIQSAAAEPALKISTAAAGNTRIFEIGGDWGYIQTWGALSGVNNRILMNTVSDQDVQIGPANAGLYVDNANNRVGIKVNAPTVDLDINAVARLTPSDSPPTCSSTIYGALYYDASLQRLCYCQSGGASGAWCRVNDDTCNTNTSCG